MGLTALFAEATVMTLGLALSSLALGLFMAIAFSLAELSRFKPLALATSTVVAILLSFTTPIDIFLKPVVKGLIRYSGILFCHLFNTSSKA
ncbi:hypothetical protein [Endozoicomonas atrinae]|uniref:hypothetical protein n=1 Tax=Endozoicomonas atrinae TaxID=1333660 RepID=UPI003B00588A